MRSGGSLKVQTRQIKERNTHDEGQAQEEQEEEVPPVPAPPGGGGRGTGPPRRSARSPPRGRRVDARHVPGLVRQLVLPLRRGLPVRVGVHVPSPRAVRHRRRR